MNIANKIVKSILLNRMRRMERVLDRWPRSDDGYLIMTDEELAKFVRYYSAAHRVYLHLGGTVECGALEVYRGGVMEGKLRNYYRCGVYGSVKALLVGTAGGSNRKIKPTAKEKTIINILDAAVSAPDQWGYYDAFIEGVGHRREYGHRIDYYIFKDEFVCQ